MPTLLVPSTFILRPREPPEAPPAALPTCWAGILLHRTRAARVRCYVMFPLSKKRRGHSHRHKMSYLYGEFEAELNGSHFGVYVRAYNMLFLYHTFTRLCCLHCAHCWECAAHACTSGHSLSLHATNEKKSVDLLPSRTRNCISTRQRPLCATPPHAPRSGPFFAAGGRGLNLVTR